MLHAFLFLVFLQLTQKYNLEYQTSLFLGVCLTVFKVNFWLQLGHNSLLLKMALCFTIVELVFSLILYFISLYSSSLIIASWVFLTNISPKTR